MEKSHHLRIEAVENLVNLNFDIQKCLEEIQKFDWDYNGVPFVLKRVEVEKVLALYLRGEITSEIVETWADAIELREDIAYEEADESWVDNVIYYLANPLLNEPTSIFLVQRLLKDEFKILDDQ